MKKYNIEFTFGGKKYKGVSKGVDKDDAIRRLRKKIVITNIECAETFEDSIGDATDFLMKTFGFK